MQDLTPTSLQSIRSRSKPPPHQRINADTDQRSQEAVASLLIRSGVATAFRQIGLPDAFLDAGALPTLHDRYGISTQAISQQIKGWL